MRWDARSGEQIGAWNGQTGNGPMRDATGFDEGELRSPFALADERGEPVSIRSPTGHHRLDMRDGRLLLVEEDSGLQVCELVGHQSTIVNARFSPDGVHVLTGSLDRTAKVWAVPPLSHAHPPIDGHAQAPSEERFTTDDDGVTDHVGDLRAVFDGSVIRLTRPSTGEELRRLEGHTGGIDQAVFSLDGKQLVTACAYGFSLGSLGTSVRVWDLESGIEIRRFDGTTQNEFMFSQDGTELIVNGVSSPATWKAVLQAVNEGHVRGMPRDLTLAERIRYSLVDQYLTPDSKRLR